MAALPPVSLYALLRVYWHYHGSDGNEWLGRRPVILQGDWYKWKRQKSDAFCLFEAGTGLASALHMMDITLPS